MNSDGNLLSVNIRKNAHNYDWWTHTEIVELLYSFSAIFFAGCWRKEFHSFGEQPWVVSYSGYGLCVQCAGDSPESHNAILSGSIRLLSCARSAINATLCDFNFHTQSAHTMIVHQVMLNYIFGYKFHIFVIAIDKTFAAFNCFCLLDLVKAEKDYDRWMFILIHHAPSVFWWPWFIHQHFEISARNLMPATIFWRIFGQAIFIHSRSSSTYIFHGQNNESTKWNPKSLPLWLQAHSYALATL